MVAWSPSAQEQALTLWRALEALTQVVNESRTALLLESFSWSCKILAADLSRKRTREGLSEDYAHCLRSSLHHLFCVPGVSEEVEKEIAATAHDQLILRMCTAVQNSNNVVHPLLVDRLDSLDLTGFAEYDYDCFIQGKSRPKRQSVEASGIAERP
jgi:hypothetical protein